MPIKGSRADQRGHLSLCHSGVPIGGVGTSVRQDLRNWHLEELTLPKREKSKFREPEWATRLHFSFKTVFQKHLYIARWVSVIQLLHPGWWKAHKTRRSEDEASWKGRNTQSGRIRSGSSPGSFLPVPEIWPNLFRTEEGWWALPSAEALAESMLACSAGWGPSKQKPSLLPVATFRRPVEGPLCGPERKGGSWSLLVLTWEGGYGDREATWTSWSGPLAKGLVIQLRISAIKGGDNGGKIKINMGMMSGKSPVGGKKLKTEWRRWQAGWWE